MSGFRHEAKKKFVFSAENHHLKGMNDRENSITGQIKKGDETAFKDVFVAWFEPLFLFAREYVINEEVARNLCQETFLTLWEKRQSLNDESNIKAYLYKITRNNCLNYLKNVQVNRRYQENLRLQYREMILNYGTLADLNFEQLEFDELYTLIQNTIESLPPQCKKIFKMSRYEQLKNKQIALELDISEKAVEKQISKALHELRDTLEKNYPAFIIPFLFFNL